MATRFDKFTVKAQEALQGTQEIAGRYGHQQLEPAHLLLALIQQPEGTVSAILARLGVQSAALAKEAEKLLNGFPNVGGATAHYLSPALHDVLDQAANETEPLQEQFACPVHL